jgi:hypothetical protein
MHTRIPCDALHVTLLASPAPTPPILCGIQVQVLCERAQSTRHQEITSEE